MRAKLQSIIEVQSAPNPFAGKRLVVFWFSVKRTPTG